MVNARIYIEGGGESKDLHVECRKGFRLLLEACGFAGRMPRLIACGSRSAAYDDFCTEHAAAKPGTYVAMIVDSEDPVADIEQTWSHLRGRDGWAKPRGADDEQVLLMVTCMETWIVADRATLRRHYKSGFQESALPTLANMESRTRSSIQDGLVRATRNCTEKYAKGAESFRIVALLDPAELRKHLPSFVRFERVLNEKL